MKTLKDSAEWALELLSEAVEYVNEPRNLFRSQSLEEDCKEAIAELHELLSQPKHEWQGLTAHEINDAYIAAEKQAADAFAVTRRQIADAITAKLKEKNT